MPTYILKLFCLCLTLDQCKNWQSRYSNLSHCHLLACHIFFFLSKKHVFVLERNVPHTSPSSHTGPSIRHGLAQSTQTKQGTLRIHMTNVQNIETRSPPPRPKPSSFFARAIHPRLLACHITTWDRSWPFFSTAAHGMRILGSHLMSNYPSSGFMQYPMGHNKFYGSQISSTKTTALHLLHPRVTTACRRSIEMVRSGGTDVHDYQKGCVGRWRQ
jgi:hypothetical protein